VSREICKSRTRGGVGRRDWELDWEIFRSRAKPVALRPPSAGSIASTS
jgi:hypothetical protein